MYHDPIYNENLNPLAFFIGYIMLGLQELLAQFQGSSGAKRFTKCIGQVSVPCA
jgi:hypothetical protein